MQTAAQQQAALEQRQDELRPYRQFLSLVSGFNTVDQTYGTSDGIVANAPGQFAVYGPYGIAMEGQPVMATNQQAMGAMSPMLLVVGALVVGYLLMK